VISSSWRLLTFPRSTEQSSEGKLKHEKLHVSKLHVKFKCPSPSSRIYFCITKCINRSSQAEMASPLHFQCYLSQKISLNQTVRKYKFNLNLVISFDDVILYWTNLIFTFFSHCRTSYQTIKIFNSLQKFHL